MTTGPASTEDLEARLPRQRQGARELPRQKTGAHDALAGPPEGPSDVPAAAPRPAVAARVPAALEGAVERQLASLAGVDHVPAVPEDAEVAESPPISHAGAAEDLPGRLRFVAQVAAVGALVVVAVAALVAARFGGHALHVAPLPLTAWASGAAVAAVSLAAAAARGHRWTAALLLLALLVGTTGAVTTAGGVGGPAWVLFLPVVLVSGAMLGPAGGLAVGALAGAGIYSAAGLSHTLDIAGVGRLVVLLPTCPAAGWAAGALGSLATRAATEARAQRERLEADIARLTDLLAEVSAGDLTRVPATGGDADPVAQTLAVVFADTLTALRRLVRQMTTCTEQLAGSAGELAAATTQEVAAVELQAAAVSETTSTIEQLAATAAAIADIAQRVTQFAGSTRRDVDAGAAAVAASAAAMEQIADRITDLTARSRQLQARIARIDSATRLIDELSRRTAILSVNASIEAARAGDARNGFDTVATEVAELATRARAATKQIAEVVAGLHAGAAATADASADGLLAVADGLARQREVAAALEQITEMVDRTTAAARGITGATRQQRVASDAVVAAMVTVSDASARYRAGSRRHADAAEGLRDLVAEVQPALARFRVT